MTQPTMLDLYQDEEFISTPGVTSGLLKSATPDNPAYRIVDRNNGSEGVFYRTEGGMQYFLGNRPKAVPVGEDPMMQQPGFGETSPSQFARGVGETASRVAKGVVQGFAGLPGDLESISKGLLNQLDAPAMQRIQSSPTPFLRAFYELAQSGIDFDKFVAGMDEDTVLFPTVKDVGQAIDETGIMPELKVLDKEGVAPAELMGELLAPVTYIESAKRVGRGIKKGAQEVKKAVTKRGAKNTIPPTKQEPN
jgi:hypothetical protein